jgi:hypothetical protein
MFRKEYVLTDIMRKRKKDQQAVDSKIRNKLALKKKREKSKDALKAPEKFIKQYRAQQKSYSHYRLKVILPSCRIDKPSVSQKESIRPMPQVWENYCLLLE